MRRAPKQPATPCDTCNRDPKRMNSAVAECSHVACPHRRGNWAGGTREHDLRERVQAQENPGDVLFDRQEV